MKKTFLAMMMAVAATACGGDDGGGGGGGEDPPTAAEAQAICQEACDHDAMCGSQTPVAECVSGCTQIMPAFRESAANTMLACQTAACNVVDDTCYAMVEPAEYHVQYETTCTTKLTECGLTDAIPQVCDVDGGGDSGFFLLFNEGVMTDLTACFQQPCDMIFNPCFSGVFAPYGIDF